MDNQVILENRLSDSEIRAHIKPFSKNPIAAFFQNINRGVLCAWYAFSDKHPKLSKLLYQIILFVVFSQGITIFQYLLTLFLPMMFGLKLAATEFLWPKIFMYNAGGRDWFFNLLGYAVVYDSAGNVIIGGGLGYFIAFEIATFLAQVINFPLQRNITFKSHGNPYWQAMWYFIGWILVSLFCNGVNSLWMPIADGAAGTALPQAVKNIITMVIMGGISMCIFFFIFLIIFPDYKVSQKRAEARLSKLKTRGGTAEEFEIERENVLKARERATLFEAEKLSAKTAAQANAAALAYVAAVSNAKKEESSAAKEGVLKHYDAACDAIAAKLNAQSELERLSNGK